MKHTKADLSGAVAELVDLARTNGANAKDIIYALQPYNFTRDEIAKNYGIMEGDYTLTDLEELLDKTEELDFQVADAEELDEDLQTELMELEDDIKETIIYLGGDIDYSDWKCDDKPFDRKDATYTEPQELFDRAKHLGVL